jgi:hypothetical protein
MLDVVDHADLDEADVRYVECHSGGPAVLTEEVVCHVDGKLFF